MADRIEEGGEQMGCSVPGVEIRFPKSDAVHSGDRSGFSLWTVPDARRSPSISVVAAADAALCFCNQPGCGKKTTATTPCSPVLVERGRHKFQLCDPDHCSTVAIGDLGKYRLGFFNVLSFPGEVVRLLRAQRNDPQDGLNRQLVAMFGSEALARPYLDLHSSELIAKLAKEGLIDQPQRSDVVVYGCTLAIQAFAYHLDGKPVPVLTREEKANFRNSPTNWLIQFVNSASGRLASSKDLPTTLSLRLQIDYVRDVLSTRRHHQHFNLDGVDGMRFSTASF